MGQGSPVFIPALLVSRGIAVDNFSEFQEDKRENKTNYCTEYKTGGDDNSLHSSSVSELCDGVLDKLFLFLMEMRLLGREGSIIKLHEGI